MVIKYLKNLGLRVSFVSITSLILSGILLLLGKNNIWIFPKKISEAFFILGFILGVALFFMMKSDGTSAFRLIQRKAISNRYDESIDNTSSRRILMFIIPGIIFFILSYFLSVNGK
jgi:hypothetical protein